MSNTGLKMGENNEHNVEEKKLTASYRSRTISSDSEDCGLKIDLDSEYYTYPTKAESNNANNTAINNVKQEELSIGCEETETSINFFVKAEIQEEKNKSVRPDYISDRITRKKFKFEEEPFGYEKQNDVLKFQMQRGRMIEIKLSSKKCPKCEFEGTVVKDLHEHMKSCVRTKYFNCLECPYTCRDGSSIVKHKKSHALQSAAFSCTMCTFGTYKRVLLRLHMQWHLKASKPETEDFFKCPVCTFTGTYSKTIVHFRVHAKEHEHLKNVIECPLCGMKSKNSNFTRHTRHHITTRLNQSNM